MIFSPFSLLILSFVITNDTIKSLHHFDRKSFDNLHFPLCLANTFSIKIMLMFSCFAVLFTTPSSSSLRSQSCIVCVELPTTLTLGVLQVKTIQTHQSITQVGIYGKILHTQFVPKADPLLSCMLPQANDNNVHCIPQFIVNKLDSFLQRKSFVFSIGLE